MNFGQALEALKEGKKVKRAHWGGYWFLTTHVNARDVDGYEFGMTQIVARLKDGGYAPATAYQDDLLFDDWEVVNQ